MPDTAPTAEEEALHNELLSLDNQLCFAVYSAARRIVRGYRPLLDELGLTYPQYLVMLVLWGWQVESNPRPRVTDLGERLELDSGTLTPLLRRLEHKKLLKRQRSSQDERELHVRLTAAGRRLKQRAAQVPLTVLANSPLPAEELFELREQLKKLRLAQPD